MAVEVVFDITAQVAGIIDRAVRDACKSTADDVAVLARDEIFAQPKSGRRYNRPPRGWYTASAPGEPPAWVEGALGRSILSGDEPDGASVVASDRIAHTMEFGTAGGKIAPRPFMTPAAEAYRQKHVDRVADAVKKVTNG